MSRPGDASAQAYPAIADYALLSDCHGAALVSRDGSIDWCCLARFDARPVFSRLLDWRRGGFFRIAPVQAHRASRRYLPDTTVLETRFETDEGTLVLTDFLVLAKEGARSDPHGTERPVAENRLVRRLRCERGRATVAVDFEPRFNFGATTPHLRLDDGHVVQVYGGADALVLQADAPLEIREEGCASCRPTLRAGEALDFVLTYALPHRLEAIRLDAGEIERRFEWTVDFWRSWMRRCCYEGDFANAVRRSALVLKALTNVETGGIVAAPTTSLPEEIGGVRNWDYRYVWLRDASLVLESLYRLGYRAEGRAFMDWLHRTTAGIPAQLQIMYGEGGERLLPEVLLEEVEGYRRSRPVRIGNAASRQFQLDIYGDVLQAAWSKYHHTREMDDDLWMLLSGLVDYVAEHWERPDSGLWEVRSEPEHFVHSKVMCWVGVDRGIRIAEDTGRGQQAQIWRRVRDAIRDRVMTEGVDRETGCFVRAFGSRTPDAAALLFPILGFVPADDPLARATRQWIEAELTDQGLVRRYRARDGLPGGEGAFTVCSFWLVQNLALDGEIEQARELFARLLGHANDLGLLSEEIHTETGELLGNFPQSLSHIGLINAAVTLDEASRGVAAPRERAGSPT